MKTRIKSSAKPQVHQVATSFGDIPVDRLNKITLGVCRIDIRNGESITSANKPALRMFGYSSQKAFFTIRVSDLFLNPSIYINLRDELNQHGSVHLMETEFTGKKGNQFTGLVSAFQMNDPLQNPLFIDLVIEEITEKKWMMEELKKSRENYYDLYQNTPVMLFSVSPGGKIVSVNNTGLSTLGYERSELIGKSVWKVVHKGDLKEVKSTLKSLVDSRQILGDLDFRKVKKNGEVIHVMERTQLVLDQDNEVKEIRIACRDITKRKIIEENLRHQEERYRNLTNNLNVGLYRSTMESRGKFVEVNQAFLRMFGYKSKNELFARNVSDLYLHTSDRLELRRKINEAGFVKNQEVVLKKKTGEPFIASLSTILSRDPSGKQTYFDGIIEDITEQKMALEDLYKKEEQYRTLFNISPNGILIENHRGIILDVNPAFCDMIGYTKKQLIGANVSLLAHPEVKRNVQPNIRKILNGKQLSHTEKSVRKDGSIVYVYLNERKFDLPDGKAGIICIAEDITDRKLAEEEIRESQRRLSTLMGNLPGMAYRCMNDKNWTMEFVSEGCFDLTGYPSTELINNRKISYNDIIHPDDRKMVWKTVQDAVKKKESFQMTYRILTARGTEEWVWEQGSGIFSENNRLIALEGFISNITDQVEKEKEIRKLSRSVEQSPTITLITDLDGRIEYVNPRFTEVTGYKFDEIRGETPGILKSGQTPDRVYKDLWKTITSGKEWTGEFLNRKKNGALYWESANIFPLKDDRGRITHFIGMKEDITRRKQMEQELIVAKEKAEESDKLKSAFLANMSHEIRTPMNSIIGFSQLLDEPGLSAEDRSHFINLIQSSSNDLMNLIDDIIDISKIEAGQMKIYISQNSIHAMMEELHEHFLEYIKTKADKRNLNIVYKKPSSAEKYRINTDPDRFRQVFKNLLNNAVKFTDQGFVEFGFSASRESSTQRYQFYVKDTGIGISSADTGMIFNSFTQAHSTSSKLYGGTGLGLSITKKIVEILGGKIWVDSEPGKGSTFYFSLPNPELSASGSTAQRNKIKPVYDDYNWEGKRILIVEDDDNSFNFFLNSLKKTHLAIERAQDGRQALNLLKKTHYHLVLLDIRLPRLDGFKALRKMKTMDPQLPVIAQTAYAMQGERERCLATGFDDYISKPVKIGDLRGLIDRHIR